jgi:NDP-sugar pyrophosphorylase family protein
VVRTSGVDIVGFEEKPVIKSHINAGVYALDPGVLAHMQKDEHCDMPTLFGKLQDRGLRTVVYPMHEPWLDVGRADDYVAANQKAES